MPEITIRGAPPASRGPPKADAAISSFLLFFDDQIGEPVDRRLHISGFLQIDVHRHAAVERFFQRSQDETPRFGQRLEPIDVQTFVAQRAIERLDEHNHKPKPFVWRVDPIRAHVTIERGSKR